MSYFVRRWTLEGALGAVVREIGASGFHLVREPHFATATVGIGIHRCLDGGWLPRLSGEVLKIGGK